ncbi:MAG: hypothetical protein JWN76_467 [Chitinophagaceae bacterium]|nr:hypothetical protein [Chitinophagaceae bacterium]
MKTGKIISVVLLAALAICIFYLFKYKSDAEKWRSIETLGKNYQAKKESRMNNLYGASGSHKVPIDKSLAKDFRAAFETFGHGHMQKDFTRSVWIDKAELARYLYYTLDPKYNADGLRIYFATYESPDMPPGFPLAKKMGIITVATVLNNGFHNDTMWKTTTKTFDYYEGLEDYHDLCPPQTNCDNSTTIWP